MGKRIIKIGMEEIGSRPIHIGYMGENDHTEVVIDCAAAVYDRPDAEIALKARPAGGEIYAPAAEQDGGRITWTLTREELTGRSGAYQVTITDGEEIIKSAVGHYSVNESLREVS